MGALVKAAGIIVTRRLSDECQYLLLRASYKPYHWSPPKGHVDPGEDDLTTALRETEEEAGLTLEDLILKDDFKVELNYTVNGKPKKVLYWLAEMKDNNKKIELSSEHQDLAWLPLEEACLRSGYQDMQDALKKAHDFLRQ